jgi:DNA-binding NarL/FixJ family response regulator
MEGVMMASVGPFDTTSSLHNTRQAAPTSTTNAEAVTRTALTSQEDTVTLSAAAQAMLLHQQGHSVTTIAASLGLDVKTVDSYLGVPMDSTSEDTLDSTGTGRD